jgi:ATP-dependent Clp protease ATP-binding subunit ClpC
MIGFDLNNKFYYWGERIDKASLALKRVRDSINLVINLTSMLVAALLMLFFAYHLGFVVEITDALTFGFWLDPTLPLAAFWLALLVTAFIWFRLIQASEQKTKVAQKAFDAELPVVGVADDNKLHGKNKVDIAKAFNLQAKRSVEESYLLAERFSQTIEPLHLLIGTLNSNQVTLIFARLGLDFTKVKDPLNRRLNSLEKNKVGFSDAATTVLLNSYLSAFENHRQQVGPIELFQQAYKADEFVQELFYDLGVELEQLTNVIEWIRINEEIARRYQEYSQAASRKPKGAMNRAMTSLATPMLDQVGEDLTRAAAYGNLPMLIGRDSEVEQIFRVIEGGNQSAVLVGPPGVGKKAVVYGIAQRMVEEQVPKSLEDKRLVRLSIPHLVSGAAPEQVQERLLRVLHEVSQSRNIILVIDNIHEITGISSGTEMTADLSSILIDALSRGSTFLVATTTPEAYAASIERTALGQALQKVNITEPEHNQAIQIIEAKINAIEYKNNVIFSYAALEQAVSLSDRYMHDRFLPIKAIELCQETALAVFKARGKGAMINAEDVAKIVAEKTKIPVASVAEEEKTKLLHLEQVMHERMIGQDHAVDSVAAALRRARAELRAGDRPIANFLFLGPTGVGKTELAKTTSEAYFGSEGSMIRFDMSEYQNQTSVAKLIGAAGQAGQLTEAVRQNPFSLLLLDELEKAHPDILNLFLQVMDDGRLTDGAGRTIDFTNVILIATSNAGTSYIQDQVAANTEVEQIKTHLIETELKQIYRPEFLNRFDDIIVFKPLNIDEVEQIAYLMINQVSERLEAKGIHFRADDQAVHDLAEQGFDPKFGARPLRRVIQDKVENTVADVLLQNKAGRRDTLVLQADGQIKVEKAAQL